jgi:hypothetical protein
MDPYIMAHNDPAHIDSAIIDPVCNDPVIIDSTIIDTAHIDPVHIDPVHNEHVHIDPVHSESIIIDPVHIESIIIDPVIIDPVIIDETLIIRCNYCEFETTDIICLMDHTMILHDNLYGYVYECDMCDSNFETEGALDDHMLQMHAINTNDSGDDTDNEEHVVEINHQITQNISYLCPSCNLGFRTQFHLGEHFTQNHQSYQDQTLLDNNVKDASFPGFEILEHMDVITIPTRKKISMLIKNETCCDICCKLYAIYNYKNIDKMEKRRITMHDLDQLLHKPTHGVSIYDEDLDNKMTTRSYPIIMMCCDNIICNNCIKTYLMSSAYIKCPFCNNDHTKYNIKHIKIIDPITYDKKAWMKWWRKNDKIDLLAF